MRKFLIPALALSLLLNAALLLRRPEPPPPVVRTQVIERTVVADPPPAPASPATRPTSEPPIVVSTAPAPLPTPAVRPTVSLLASPGFVEPGGEITVTCTLHSGAPAATHWIGLYAVDAHLSNYQGYHMIASLPATFVFKAPRIPGDYDVRYILEDNRTSIAASNPIRVFGSPPLKPMVDLQSGTTYVKRGGEIPASWALLSGNRSSKDWIGLYAADAKNEDFLTWKYVTDADQGRVTLQAPDRPGTYEMRYLLDNGYESVATSVRIVVLP
jgi:hypothetical protein